MPVLGLQTVETNDDCGGVVVVVSFRQWKGVPSCTRQNSLVTSSNCSPACQPQTLGE